MALGNSVGVLGLNGDFFKKFLEFLSELIYGDDLCVFLAVLFTKGLLHDRGARFYYWQDFLSHVQKMGWILVGNPLFE